MKNLLISGLVIGSLVACPVAFSAETKHNAAQTEQAVQATDHAKHKAKHHKRHGKKHHRKHRVERHSVKKHHAKKHHGKKHHAKHRTSAETPAEKKIDKETELNNR